VDAQAQLEISQRPGHEPEPVEVPAAGEEGLGAGDGEGAPDVRVERASVPGPISRHDGGLAHLPGIEHQLQQVFLNLFLNARDAMPRGGWLSVSTRVDGDLAVAEVADTGSGIPSEQLARIYDPFFTTKGIGRGTGLGLSIIYGIVRDHQGSIRCDSAVGQGTKFTLTLPLEQVVARSAMK